MALCHRNAEKRRILQDFRRHEEEVIGSLCRLSNRPISPKTQMEQERRIRREIANSNERRRMQSINAGFQSLRSLLPHHEGEKLSKAAILQQTTQYIYQIEQDKTRLLTQNCQLKRLLNQQNQDSDGGSSSDSPLPKRKKGDAESGVLEDPISEEVVVNGSSKMVKAEGGGNVEDLKRELIELRIQLDRERRMRLILEEQARSTSLYPKGVVELQPHMQLVFPSEGQFAEQDKIARGTPPSGKNSPMSTNSLPSPFPNDDQVQTAVTSPSVTSSGPPTASRDAPVCRARSVSDEEGDAMVMDEVDDYKEEMAAQQQSRCCSPPSRIPEIISVPTSQHIANGHYLASTSRQNLETIVEAIRHLEGDHLFDDPEPRPAQIKKEEPQQQQSTSSPTNLVPVTGATVTFVAADLAYRHPHVIHSTQTRPGVIVSAHS